MTGSLMQPGFILLVAAHKGHLVQAIIHALIQRKGDIIHSNVPIFFKMQNTELNYPCWNFVKESSLGQTEGI